MSPLSLVFSICAFASGFAMRIIDPLILPIAERFEVTPATAAMMSPVTCPDRGHPASGLMPKTLCRS